MGTPVGKGQLARPRIHGPALSRGVMTRLAAVGGLGHPLCAGRFPILGRAPARRVAIFVEPRRWIVGLRCGASPPQQPGLAVLPVEDELSASPLRGEPFGAAVKSD